MIVRLRVVIVVLVLLLVSIPVSAQSVPDTMTQALSQLSSLVGFPVTLQQLEFYSWEIGSFPDTHLGCALAVFPAQTGTYVGYHYTLTLNGTAYDLRVSGDGTIAFPCVADGGGAVGVATSTVTPGQNIPTAAITPCPTGFVGYLTPHLSVGGQGRIELGGTPNRLRTQPSVLAPQIGVIQAGSTMTVLAGPSCEAQSVNGQANIVFWQVNANGVIGWTAEGMLPNDYFIEAIGGGSTNTSSSVLPGEHTLITPDNAAELAILAAIPSGVVTDLDVGSSALNGMGIIAAASSTGALFYNATTLEPVNLISGATQGANTIAISDAGRYVAIGYTNSNFTVIDTTSNTRIDLQVPQQGRIEDLDFGIGDTPKLAIGFASSATPNAGQFILMNTPIQGTPEFPYAVTTTAPVYAVGFSPDGTTVAWLDRQINVLNLLNNTLGSPVSVAAVSGGLPPTFAYVPMTAMACGPSACTPVTLAVSEAPTVRVINMTNAARPEVRLSLSSVLTPVNITYSRDGSLLFVFGLVPATPAPASPSLTVFNVQTSSFITQINFEAATNAMTISQDGAYLVLQMEDELLLIGVPGGEDAVG